MKRGRPKGRSRDNRSFGPLGDLIRSHRLAKGLGLLDVAKACEAVRARGGKVTREAGPVKGGTTVIAFVEDPDGYKIEFIQTS